MNPSKWCSMTLVSATRFPTLRKAGMPSDRIELLHGSRRDIAAAERIEPPARQLGAVAQIGEQLLLARQGPNGAHEVADLAIDCVAGAAVAENRQSRSCSFRAANIKAEGMAVALKRTFICRA